MDRDAEACASSSMANDDDVPPDGPHPPIQQPVDEPVQQPPEEPVEGTLEDAPRSSLEVAIRRASAPDIWRSRAVALRTALPQLARNPVVVGASAAAATVAMRIAVDVARRALAAPSQPRSVDLTVTGSVLHHIHVIHHVHVIHHRSAADPLWPLPPRS